MAACTRIRGTNQRYWKDYSEYVQERDGESKSTVVENLHKAYDVIMAEKSKKLVEDCPESRYLKTVSERLLDRAVEQGMEADAIVSERVEEVLSDESSSVRAEVCGNAEDDHSGRTDSGVEKDASSLREVDEESVSGRSD
jgi:hypothetical protein